MLCLISTPVLAHSVEWDYPPAPTPEPPPQVICSGLVALDIKPVTPLIWDNELRAFDVRVCSPAELRGAMLAWITINGNPLDDKPPHPTAQTYTAFKTLARGENHVTLEHWRPGLENHITICVQRPSVHVEVQWSEDGKTNWRYVGEQDFPVACGGSYS